MGKAKRERKKAKKKTSVKKERYKKFHSDTKKDKLIEELRQKKSDIDKNQEELILEDTKIRDFFRSNRR